MHLSSMKNMKEFRDKYLTGKFNLRVLDVGSMDVNGSYRGLFEKHDYVGLDMKPGKGVDVVGWDGVKANSFDVVISGQAFEHIRYDLAAMKKVARALKAGAYCCIIAPSAGQKHAPPDYRRYQPDDFKVLAEKVGLKVIEVRIEDNPTDKYSRKWMDCILVAQKQREI